MKQFFKIMFASMLGCIISFLIIFLILTGIIAGIASLSDKDNVKITSNSILHIKLDEQITDRASDNPFENLNIGNMNFKTPLGLNIILDNIRKAKTDPNIKGIYIEFSMPIAGIASLEEIRNALIDFKISKKFVISYSELYTLGTYYLASVSDKIYLNPQGYFDFRGLSVTSYFFKGTLDKLDIKTEIIRGKNNKYKSAVEPLLLEKMSEANKEQNKVLITSFWNHIRQGISDARKISMDNLNNIADSLKIESATDALKYKMVDDLFYKDQLISELCKRTGNVQPKDLKIISIKQYSSVADKHKKHNLSQDKIAIIYAVGEIQGGEGDQKKIGSESLSKTIREAREDKNIKAIVLRVNSPGGMVTASEVIYREIMLAKKEKPVVVSMGNLAASGGYWISCGADKIFANPNTITGSIGVFGIMFNLQDFLKNKLGITSESVNTNSHSDIFTFSRPLTPFEKNYLQNGTEKIYHQFLEHVANGRHLTTAYVDSIGQGRIWTGEDALKLKLVDEIGGIDKAVKAAAQLAKMSDYRIVELPKQENAIMQILKNLGDEGNEAFVKKNLGEKYSLYKYIESVSNWKGIQARLPYELIIE